VIMSTNEFLDAIGVPDPINYLRAPPNERGVSSSLADRGRLDSNDDLFSEGEEHDKKQAATDNAGGKRQKRQPEDPPARERPAEGASWPYRETIVFYGAGSITIESEHVCRLIQECISLRPKYQCSKSTMATDRPAESEWLNLSHWQ
jgi:hypothetical protein